MKKARAQVRCVALGSVLSGLFLLCSPAAFALDRALDVSQYAHSSWKIRDGFTKGYITSIAQTPDGYLWLSTEFGLYRFDGVRAVPWEPRAGQQLPSNFVRSLLASRDGTLWIGTLKGLASWKDGKLTHYATPADQSVDTLLEDDEGTVWVGTLGTPSGRLCVIRGGAIQCYGEDGSFGKWIEYLFEDGQKNVWAASETGLWKLKPGPPKQYSTPSPIMSTKQTLVEGSQGVLLVSTATGIRQFVNEKTDMYLLPNGGRKLKTNKLFQDGNGGLWVAVASGGGLAHVHDGKTDFFSLADGLSGDHVQVLFEDLEGDMWVGTDGGLDRFRDYAVPTYSLKQGVSDVGVWSVLSARDGTVWLGTIKGLDRWSDGRISTYNKRDGKLNGLAPHSLFEDSRGQKWVSTSAGFGHLEDTRFISVSGIPAGIVRGIAEDTEGNLWIANQSGGLIRLRDGNVVHQIPWTGLGHKDFATAIAADPTNGGLWLGFYNGGIVHFSSGEVRAAYTAADGLGEGFVGRFRFDADGTVWAATEGGLSRVKNGHLATLTSKNGLPCDAVNWVIRDNDDSFWLNMACGLVRMNRSEVDRWATAVDKDKDTKQTIQATVFNTSEGVRSTVVGHGFSPTVTRSSDGKLWFVSLDGVSVIDPRHLPFNKIPPPVYIEQVTADRKIYDATFTGSGGASGRLRLPPLNRDLQIDYTALSLVASEKVFFRYKLDGFDNNWQDAGTRRQAFYTNLPPKNYTFRVKACNNSGVWNETGTFLDFAVAPAYYQTTWFRLSCAAAFLALLWALYQLRLQQLAREYNMRLEERVSERTRIARELHDSLLQGFQGVMFRLQAVRDMLPGRAPVEVIEALDIALDRGDKAIVEGRDTVADLREPIIGEKDVAVALTALGEELAAHNDNGTVPCVRVLVEGKQRELNPILRDEVYRIGREALRNAFRHARAQKIEAEITYGDSEFLLHVRDDGSGIDPAVGNQGVRAGHWGLPGMRERAKSFGGKLEVWSEHGAGTEIELSVPGTIAYGKSEPPRRFWLWRKKIRESDGQQS
jgi:signal transduction histidine kinase/ligand-binding sensor domain-containing protein